jgi:hypothetical protein
MNSLENIVAFKKGGNHLDSTSTTTATGGANSKDSQISSVDSTSLKFQKYLASHLSSCSIGQDVIASVVDEGTRHIISAFIMAIRRCECEVVCPACCIISCIFSLHMCGCILYAL